MNRLFTRPIVLLSTLFIILGGIYAWATPPFEASDEYWHFGMVEYIHDHQSLPVQDPDAPDTLYRQEGSQPPLYYALAAMLISPFDLSDIDDYRVPNPHVRAGQPDSTNNKNFVLHDVPNRYSAQSMLAVTIVRLFSIGLGLVTVLCVYANTRLIAPTTPYVALLAAGLLAFNPMFLFISASINNDNLVTALSGIVIYLMLRMLQDGFDNRRSVWLALLVALATLTKLSALVLVPVVVLAALWVAYRDNEWRGLVILGSLMAGIWAVMAGWWYLRNIQLYDELFGTSMMVKIAGSRAESFALSTALDEFEGFRWAFWGVFGVFDLIVPYHLFYLLLDVLVLVAGVGLLSRFRRKDRVHISFLSLIVLIGFIAFIQWTAQTYASQGRLLFPYNAAILPLLAIGLYEAFRGGNWAINRILPQLHIPPWGILWPTVGLGLVALILPFTLIAPAYKTPAPITTLPGSATPIYARYGDVELVGYDAIDQRYLPGDSVPVTLYWRVIAPSVQNNSLYLTFVDLDGTGIGKVDSYPGGGRLLTSRWEVGTLYSDTYEIVIDAEASGRYPLRLQVGWWHYPTETVIIPLDNNDVPLDSVMLNAGAFVSVDTLPDVRDFTSIEAVQFSNVIRLSGYNYIPEFNELLLHWESTGNLGEDYTVFAQVLDAENNVIGQGDAPPTLPTHYWQPGEQFVTRHLIYYPETPPAGEYRLIVGWYRPSDFARLDTDTPDNAYVVMAALDLR
jgi:hypothetical protein